jgi:hypothetical protein
MSVSSALESSFLETTIHQFRPETIITATSHRSREHRRYLAMFLSGKAHTLQPEHYCAVPLKLVLTEGKLDPVRFDRKC